MPLPNQSADIADYYDLLYRLGVTANSTGFFYTAYAAYLAANQPFRLLYAAKWLYPSVAKQYRTSWSVVERGVCAALTTAWETDPVRLSELAHCPLREKPSPSQFISILAAQFVPIRSA